MEPFKINIATYNYLEERLARKLVAFLLVLVIFFSFFNMLSWTKYKGEIDTYEKKIDNLHIIMAEKDKDTKERAPELSEAQQKSLEAEMDFISHIILKDVFPWPKFLDTFERRTPPGVILESIVYSGNMNEILITGKANSTQELLAFSNGLGGEKGLENNLFSILSVAPVGERTISDSKEIAFEVTSQIQLKGFIDRGPHQ